MKIEILRIKRLITDLEKLIYISKHPVESFKILNDKRQDGYLLNSNSWEEFTTDKNWLARDKHRWFKTKIKITDEFAGGIVIFQITTGREGQWDACNPQFLFYVNNQLIQGCDVNHREVIITEKAEEGEEFEIAFLAYGGTQGNDLLIKCHLALLDSETEAIYYDMKIPLDACELIYDNDVHNRINILRELNPVADQLDLRKPYSREYYNSIHDCREMLKSSFYSNVSESPIVSAIGNTHIDIAWLWTVDQTREKVLRSYSTVIELMNRYPEYKFIGSQAILYQFVKDQNPELYEKIKQKIKEGQWEVDGGMWLEADCNIPSGESLIRQIIKGESFFMEEFGVRSKTLWLPDVFGYSAAIPQILKQFDMPYFVTTKIAWNQYNQLPNDVFKWRGLDGSEVFTFMPTTSDYDKSFGDNISFTDTRNTTTYTGIIGPNMTLGTYKRFQNKDLTQDTLMLYGYGDGGGGPTKEMLENEKRLRFGLPGIPRIKTEFNRDYLDRTYRKLINLPNTPTWDGELYFEYHRGTLTSNGSVKKWNRKIEILLRKLEIITSINYIKYGSEIPQNTISEIWDVLLLNQFHDIIPGTSIEEVYEVAELEYKEAYLKGKTCFNEAFDKLQSYQKVNNQSLTVFNALPHYRNDIVCAKVNGISYTHISDGSNFEPIQYLDDNTIVFVANSVPQIGIKEFQLISDNKCSKIKKNTSELEFFEFQNEYYELKINKHGEIESLVEKETSFEYFGKDVGNKLMYYEDRPGDWDNWDIDIFYKRKPYFIDSSSSLKLIEAGPVRWTLEIEHKIVDSTLKQNICVYKNLPRIDFKHIVEWKENNLLLRASFPTNIRQNKATFDVQFGSVERETTNNNSWELAKFETCAHKWVDLSNNGVGLSLLNDSKYGFSIKDNTIGISLIKSGKYPNDNADIGRHEYTYSLYPHSKRWVESQTVEQAENLNSKLDVCFNRDSNKVEASMKLIENSFIEVLNGNCFIDTIKQAEIDNRIIVRVYENKNTYGNIVIRVPDEFKKASVVNLREEVVDSIEIIDNQINFSLSPYEIKTFAFNMNE